MIVNGVVRRRKINAGSFAAWPGLVFAGVVPPSDECPGGIAFDGDLTAEEQSAIWWWMTSTSDADETARRALNDFLPTGDDALDAVISYLLGLT